MKNISVYFSPLSIDLHKLSANFNKIYPPCTRLPALCKAYLLPHANTNDLLSGLPQPFLKSPNPLSAAFTAIPDPPLPTTSLSMSSNLSSALPFLPLLLGGACIGV